MFCNLARHVWFIDAEPFIMAYACEWKNCRPHHTGSRLQLTYPRLYDRTAWMAAQPVAGLRSPLEFCGIEIVLLWLTLRIVLR